VCICADMYICTYICIYVYTYIHTYVHTHIHIVRVSGTVDLELQKLMLIVGYALPYSAGERVCVLENGLCVW
jgi:hypothetical protein